MTTKEYLGQAKELERKINILKKEIEKMRTLSVSVSIKNEGERVQASKGYDPMADTVVRILEREKVLSNLINMYLDKKEQIEGQLSVMDNAYYSDVLFGRYVSGLNLFDLSYQIGKKRRQTINILNKAVAAFGEQYGECYADVPKTNFDLYISEK